MLALAALAALAVWPLLRAGYPAIGDGLNHFYRLVEFEHLLAHGAWFPRWATDLGYGFGYPVFNYSPPLPYYLGALLHALGLDEAASLLGVYLLAWALAITGAYRLAREHGGPAAGLVAAAAYGLAPYLYFNSLARGALPETLGLGLLPWCLLAFYRLARQSGSGISANGGRPATRRLPPRFAPGRFAKPLHAIEPRGHKTRLRGLGACRFAPQPKSPDAPSGSARPGGHVALAASLPGLGTVLASALLYAALILTHLLTALLALPLILLVWLIAIASAYAWRARRSKPASTSELPTLAPHTPRSSRGAYTSAGVTHYQLPVALLLALALSAYFLLPALLETRYVQISQLTQPGDLDFRNNFLRLGDLLAWPQTFDARLVFRSIPPSLSLIAVALAIVGLAVRALRSWRANVAAPVLEAWDFGLWLGFLVLALLCLGFTRPVWEHLPGASLIQFPWRLVGPASLLLALLAARAVDALDVRGPRVPDDGRSANLSPRLALLSLAAWVTGVLPALALAALFFYSLTWTFSSGPPAPPSASVRELAGYERASGQLGTTSAAEFLPVGVQRLPDPHSLDGSYALHSVIERLGPLPAGVTLETQDATVGSAGAVVTVAAPVALTFNFFDFPGWRATVDGVATPITASTPNGLITVPVPAGRHTVRVTFATTPLRAAASVLSLAGVAFVALTLFRSRPQPAVAPDQHRPDGLALAFPLVCIALLLVRAVAIDGHATPFAQSRFDGQNVAGAGQALDANFDDQLVLIGLDAPSAGLAADAALPVTLYWRAQNVPAADYSTTLQVFDEQGNQWGQSDSQNPGRLPTSRWAPGQYARDDHLLRLQPGTPPGTYRLAAGVYPAGGAGVALSVLDENRVPQGQLAPLGTITVARGQWTAAAIHPAQPEHQALGSLTWLGFSLSSTAPQAGLAQPQAGLAQTQAGDELILELFWRAGGAARPDLSLHLALLGADGTAIQVWDVPPAGAGYPTSAWAPAEIVRSVQRLRIPAGAPAGRASLQLSLVPTNGAGPVAGPVPVALLDLRAPARSYAIPVMAHVSNADLGRLVRLLGYDLNVEQVTLYWQALAPMDRSYTVFVHALGPGGAILSQVDALPLGGARPTTGWLPGEVLADPYTLPLAGAVTLEAGLFDANTLQRVGTVNIPLP